MLQQLGLTQAIPVVRNKVTQGRDAVLGYHNALPWPQPTCTKKQKKKNHMRVQQSMCCATSLTAIVETYTKPVYTHRGVQWFLQWLSAFNDNCNQWREICKFHSFYHASLHNGADGAHGFQQSQMASVVIERFRVMRVLDCLTRSGILERSLSGISSLLGISSLSQDYERLGTRLVKVYDGQRSVSNRAKFHQCDRIPESDCSRIPPQICLFWFSWHATKPDFLGYVCTGKLVPTWVASQSYGKAQALWIMSFGAGSTCWFHVVQESKEPCVTMPEILVTILGKIH